MNDIQSYIMDILGLTPPPAQVPVMLLLLYIYMYIKISINNLPSLKNMGLSLAHLVIKFWLPNPYPPYYFV